MTVSVKRAISLLVLCALGTCGIAHDLGARAEAVAPTAEEKAALEAWPSVLTRTGYPHLDSGIAELRAWCERYAAGMEEPRRLSAGDVHARLRAAAVVLVGDVHDIDEHRHSFARLLRTLQPRSAPSGREFCVGLEAIPVSCQALLDAARLPDASMPGLTAKRLLQHTWPWPVDALARIVDSPELSSRVVLALGGPYAPAVPPPHWADHARRPLQSADLSLFDERRLLSVTDDNALMALKHWFRRPPAGKKQAAVLFGIAHVCQTRESLRSRLQDSGLRTEVVLPFVKEFAEVLIRDDRAALAACWYEIGAGILIPPHITWRDILLRAAK